MKYILKSYKHHKILSAVFVCLLVCLGFSLLDNGQAHAILLSGIPYDIQTGSPNYNGLGLGPYDTGGPGGCWLGGSRFTQSEWVWIFNQNGPPTNSADDASSPSSAFSINAGGQLDLGIAAMTFLCNGSITPDNTFSSGDNSFTGSNNPQDGTPNTGTGIFAGTYFTPINGWSPGSGYLTEETKFQFDEPSVSSCTNVQTGAACGGASVGGVGGNDPMTIGFQDGTRYWYPNGQSLSFTFNPPSTPGSYYIGITLPVHEANHWNIPGGADGQPGPDIYQCVDSPYNFINSIQYNDVENSCSQAAATYYVYVNVVAPTISGTVYAYNGVTEQGIANATIYTCTDGWINTNGAGQFTFTVPAGTVFCIRLVKGVGFTTTNVPAGDTVEISPNNNGPPPQPPPSCNGNSVAYNGQVAELNQSPGSCNYNLGNNSGYNIGVIVTATVSCTVGSNPSNVYSGNSATITATMTVDSWSQWGFGVPPATSASGNLQKGANNFGFTLPTYTQTSNSTYAYSNTITPPHGTGDSGQYNLSANVAAGPYSNATSCNTPNGLTVGFGPYVRSFGGDVIAGADAADTNVCEIASSGIYGNNENNTPSLNNIGSGTTVAALASGFLNGSPPGGGIDQFVSGQNLLNSSSLDPLTFANTAYSPYGGGYSLPVSCSGPDYLSQVTSLSSNSPNDSIGQCPNSNQISGMTLYANPSGGQLNQFICYGQPGQSITITGNINYNLTGANASNMPLFEVVTNSGNIIISTGVNQLAGEYIAERATIYDTDSQIIDQPPSNDNPTNTTSGDQLVIDGSFIARQIDLFRTNGSVNDSATPVGPGYLPLDSNGAMDQYDAEEFDYSPVNWLAPSRSKTLSVDSITSLPPVIY